VRLGELAAAAGEDPDGPDAAGAALPADSEPPFLEDDGADVVTAATDPAFLDETPDEAPPPGAGADLEAEAPALAAGADAAQRSADGADGEGFDLAAELSAALDELAPHGVVRGAGGDEGFREVFGAFKRGVEAALGSQDHEAHYDLGIAYREMGLLDDAIGEFRSAMASAARRIDCLHMLGLCALEQGCPDEAIDHLAHALAAPELDQERELAIRFELGRAYQQSGDAERARVAWEKVAATDPGFCEVGELLASLAVPSVPPSEFESFRDLLAEAEDEAEALPPARSRPAGAPRPPEPPRRRARRSKISFV
jgi:tetratricopeptide (TPR) repeat protein